MWKQIWGSYYGQCLTMHGKAFQGDLDSVLAFLDQGFRSENGAVHTRTHTLFDHVLTRSVDTVDKEKRTALHYAAMGGQPSVAEILLTRGAWYEAHTAASRTHLPHGRASIFLGYLADLAVSGIVYTPGTMTQTPHTIRLHTHLAP
jgi:hypothetical protein